MYFAHSDLSLREVLTLFADVPYTLASKKAYNEIISSIGGDNKINQTLLSGYYDNFNKAVDRVFSSPSDLSTRLKSSVARFSAYKANKVTSLLNDVRNKYKKDSEYKTVAKAILNTYNRYQATEYNTCVARSRTAKQWENFMKPENIKALPNIRWVPSRSAKPREAHIPFYNRVWAKNDPFWDDNQPGSLWNCKCDWQETFEPVTDNPQFKSTAQQGLKLNPAKSGEIFSSDATYFRVRNKAQVEKNCQLSFAKITEKTAKKSLLDTTAQCTIKEENKEVSKDVIFTSKGIKHCSGDMLNKIDFWLKSVILPNIDKYIKTAKYIGKKKSDITHNTKKDTVKLKENTDYFYYFEIALPNGKKCYLHLGHYKDNLKENGGKMYLYSISSNLPKNIKAI